MYSKESGQSRNDAHPSLLYEMIINVTVFFFHKIVARKQRLMKNKLGGKHSKQAQDERKTSIIINLIRRKPKRETNILHS